MSLSRRTLFFLLLAVICLAMIPMTPTEFRVLNLAMAGLALFWAVALALEDLSHARERNRRNLGPNGPG
jgi:hypothetical protein